MALYKATAWFELNGAGWSESYYRDSAGVTDLAALVDFDTVGVPAGSGIWTKRAACLGKEASIIAQEASFVDLTAPIDPVTVGDSVLNYLPMPGNEAFSAEDPFTALLIRFGDSLNTRRKHTFFRGIADGSVIEGGKLQKGNKGIVAFDGALDSFCTQLILSNYGWVGITGKVNHPVTNYVSEVGTNRIVFTVGAPALPPADGQGLIHVNGVNLGIGKRSVLDGAQVMVRIDDTSCKTKKPTAAFPFPGVGGFLRSFVKDLIQIRNFRHQKIVKRSTGKVSFVSVGRAQAKARG